MDTLCYGNTCITHSCGLHANWSAIYRMAGTFCTFMYELSHLNWYQSAVRIHIPCHVPQHVLVTENIQSISLPFV